MSPPVRDAATVLLLRDRPSGDFEVLMVRRHGQSGFMAGAHVFPGGKLDEADSTSAVLSRASGRLPEDARRALGEPDLPDQTALGLFVAALRETFEEAGVLIAERPEQDVALARERLHAGASFAAVLGELSATLLLDRIVPFARWVTPVVEPRRFDTRFFVARVESSQVAEHDRHETTEHAWLTPRQAVEATLRREILLPPPTLKSLLELSELKTAAEVMTMASARRPPYVCPVIQQVDGALTVLLPGDPLHPLTVPELSGSTRLVLEHGRFFAR